APEGTSGRPRHDADADTADAREARSPSEHRSADRASEARALLAVGAPRLGDGFDSVSGDARPGAGSDFSRPATLDHARSAGESAHDPQRANAPAAGRRREDADRDAAQHPPGRVTERPRAFIVVTGSELVRGDRHDLNGP